jgi:hypothetical protein
VYLCFINQDLLLYSAALVIRTHQHIKLNQKSKTEIYGSSAILDVMDVQSYSGTAVAEGSRNAI